MERIDVCIPWDEDRNLGAAYNRAMSRRGVDWMLFIDHDVLLLNARWYHHCKQLIAVYGKSLGFGTCWTNQINCHAQRLPKIIEKRRFDINYHCTIAEEIEAKASGKHREFTDDKYPFSGFFMLTHKEAWKKVGGFKDGFLGVDNAYFSAVQKAGYKTVRMNGLYVFHRYARYWKSGRF